jgi:fumarate reductase subunit C
MLTYEITEQPCHKQTVILSPFSQGEEDKGYDRFCLFWTNPIIRLLPILRLLQMLKESINSSIIADEIDNKSINKSIIAVNMIDYRFRFR